MCNCQCHFCTLKVWWRWGEGECTSNVGIYLPDCEFDGVCCKVKGPAAMNDEHPKLYELHWLGASVGFITNVGLGVGSTGLTGSVEFAGSVGQCGGNGTGSEKPCGEIRHCWTGRGFPATSLLSWGPAGPSSELASHLWPLARLANKPSKHAFNARSGCSLRCSLIWWTNICLFPSSLRARATAISSSSVLDLLDNAPPNCFVPSAQVVCCCCGGPVQWIPELL